MSVDENDKPETKIESEGSSPGETGAHNSDLFAGPPAKDVGPEAAKRLLPGSNQAQFDEAISLTSGRPKTAIDRHDIRGSFGAYDIKAMPISQLRPNPRNPRRHSKRQLKRLADAIKRFGFLGVIIIDQNGMILAGHGRWEAAKLLGLDTLPCVVADHLDDAAKRAFILSDIAASSSGSSWRTMASVAR